MAAPGLMTHAMMHAAGGALHSVTKPIEIISNIVAPMELPSANEIFDALRREYITPDLAQAALGRLGVNVDVTAMLVQDQQPQLNGVCKNAWASVYWAHQEIPTVQEFFEIANRQLWADPYVQKQLPRWGYVDPEMNALFGNLRYDIPGPADLVRFSVRHVWEPDLLENIGYDKEFPGGIIDVWHAMKGLDYPLFTGPFRDQVEQMTAGAGGVQAIVDAYRERGIEEPTWAKAYWWAHWVLPSPSQGYEMLFRLRPGRDPKFDPPEAEGQNFTWDDLNLLLRANDYPQKYRPLLAAIAYRIPGIRFIREFCRNGVYNYADLLEWGKRWGYSEKDSKDIADDIWKSCQPKEKTAAVCSAQDLCCEAYRVGVLSDIGLLACYEDSGVKKEQARQLVEFVTNKEKLRRLKELVANVRKRFLRGSLDVNEARTMLTSLGLAPPRIADFVDDWQFEFTAGRRELSAQSAVNYACKGLLTMDELMTRLTNLGYDQDDVNVLVGQARQCAINLLEREVEKQAKQTAANQRALMQAQRQARTKCLELQQALAKHGSPSQLQKWFCQGTIGECEVYARLGYLGWPDQDITRFLLECKQKKGEPPPRRPTGTCPPGVPNVCPIPTPPGP